MLCSERSKQVDLSTFPGHSRRGTMDKLIPFISVCYCSWGKRWRILCFLFWSAQCFLHPCCVWLYVCIGLHGKVLVAGVGPYRVCCWRLPISLTEPMPDGSKTDSPLAKAKPISSGGSTFGITYKEGEKKQNSFQQQLQLEQVDAQRRL